MTENWWKAGSSGSGLEDLVDGKIHDMGDVTFLLPNAEPASYKTSLLEVMPAVEKRD